MVEVSVLVSVREKVSLSDYSYNGSKVPRAPGEVVPHFNITVELLRGALFPDAYVGTYS